MHLRKTASETNCKFEPLLLNEPAVLSITVKLNLHQDFKKTISFNNQVFQKFKYWKLIRLFKEVHN